MKKLQKVIILFLCLFAFVNLQVSAQISANAEKFEKALKDANDVSKIYEIISGDENDMIQILCALLGDQATCALLTSAPLKDEMKRPLNEIKKKEDFDKFLGQRLKIASSEFYQKLLRNKHNEILKIRFSALKRQTGNTWR